MNRFSYILALLLLALMILVPSMEILAQCGPGPTAAGPCCVIPFPGCSCPLCAEVPLDGGLSALLFAGVAYGAKKVYNKAK